MANLELKHEENLKASRMQLENTINLLQYEKET